MTLNDWLDTVAAEIGLEDGLDHDSMHTVLDLARDAAHHVQRPAAPLTTYLLGVAVGRGAALGTVAARVTELAVSHGEADDDPDQN